jgi:hypothetical protein
VILFVALLIRSIISSCKRALRVLCKLRAVPMPMRVVAIGIGEPLWELTIFRPSASRFVGSSAFKTWRRRSRLNSPFGKTPP